MQYQQNYLRALFLILALHVRLHRYAKNRLQTQTQPNLWLTHPSFVYHVVQLNFKEVFIET